MTTCPKCGRTYHRSTERKAEPIECGLEDGPACRAYLHGIEVGRAERPDITPEDAALVRQHYSSFDPIARRRVDAARSRIDSALRVHAEKVKP